MLRMKRRLNHRCASGNFWKTNPFPRPENQIDDGFSASREASVNQVAREFKPLAGPVKQRIGWQRWFVAGPGARVIGLIDANREAPRSPAARRQPAVLQPRWFKGPAGSTERHRGAANRIRKVRDGSEGHRTAVHSSGPPPVPSRGAQLRSLPEIARPLHTRPPMCR